eukprot:16448435-Heterocapsa_arctica.AAC.1
MSFENSTIIRHLDLVEFPLRLRIKLLDTDSKLALLKLLIKCLSDRKVTLDMNQADLAVIFNKGFTDLPINYRPIALLNLSYKLLASIIQQRIALGLDSRIDDFQFGFRKKRSTLQPLFMYHRIQEIHEESGQE